MRPPHSPPRVVESLPGRPLVEDEVVDLVQRDEFTGLAYSEKESVMGEPGMISMFVSTEDANYFLGYNPLRDHWEVAWQSGDEGDLYDTLEDWSTYWHGAERRFVFPMDNVPGGFL